MRETTAEALRNKRRRTEGLFLNSLDRLFPSDIRHGLSTSMMGKQVYCFDHVTSTMDRATALANQNAPEGTVVLAESQAKGRGRRGRSWVSPKLRGLYFSVILRPKIPFTDAALITLVAAVSICEALRDVCGCPAAIKWPNDILLDHKKVGGILTEIKAEMDRIAFIVLGIGLNVNADSKSLAPHAVSLHEYLKKQDAMADDVYVNRCFVLQGLLRSLEENYLEFQKKGADPILTAWRQYADTLGRRVRVSLPAGHCEGEAVDISSDGGLLVRRDTGLVEKVMAGDVVHCR